MISLFRRRSAASSAALLLGLAAVLAACGSDGSPAASTTSTESPESVTVPMSEVLAGLPALSMAGTAASKQAAAGDFDAALDTYQELHEGWEKVEGTVKDTDPDLYEAIETAQGLIHDGADNKNADRVATGADDQATAIDSFIAGNS
jgi:hypothetical protein